jgi:hypothetical protein
MRDRSVAGGQRLKGRGAGDGAEGIEQVLAALASSGEDTGPDRGRLGAPGGAEAPDARAVDDRGAQVAPGAVVGRLDIVAVQEHVEAVAVQSVALLEPSGFGLRREVALEHHPIGGVLDQQPAPGEGLGRDPPALVVQADRAPEECRSSIAHSRAAPVSASTAKVRSRS